MKTIKKELKEFLRDEKPLIGTAISLTIIIILM
jgi:hypothetical protein